MSPLPPSVSETTLLLPPSSRPSSPCSLSSPSHSGHDNDPQTRGTRTLASLHPRTYYTYYTHQRRKLKNPKLLTCLFSLFLILITAAGTLTIVIPKYIEHRIRTAQITTRKVVITPKTEETIQVQIQAHVQVGELLVRVGKINKMKVWWSKTGERQEIGNDHHYICVRIRRQPGLTLSIGILDLPEQTFTDQPFTLDAELRISNHTIFHAFTQHMMNEDTFTWLMTGTTQISVWGVKFRNIDFEMHVPLKGLQGLKQIKMISYSLPHADDKGIHLHAKVNVWNPAPVEMQVGTVHFAMAYQNITIGQAASNMALIPGSNIVEMEGVIGCDGTCSPRFRKVLSAFFSAYMQGNDDLMIQASGLGSVVNGTEYGWLNRALKSMVLAVPFEAEKQTPITNIEMKKMTIELAERNGWAIPSLSILSSQFQLPPQCGFDVEIKGVSLAMHMLAPQPVGLLTGSSVGINQTDTKFDMSLDGIVQVSDDESQREAFEHFTWNIMNNTSVSIQVIGKVNTSVKINGIGTIDLQDIEIMETLRLKGFNEFRDNEIIIKDMELQSGQLDSLPFTSSVALYNPGTVSIWVHDILSFDIIYQSTAQRIRETVGRLQIPNFVLDVGNNIMNVSGTVFAYTPGPKGDAIRNFLARYTSGENSTVSIRGYAGNTKLPPLEYAMQSLAMSSTVPGVPPTLISYMRYNVFLRKCSVTLWNPMNVPIWLGEFDSVATYWKSPSNPSEVLLRMKANLNVTLSPGRKTTVDIRHIPMPAHVQLIMNITAVTTLRIGEYEAKVDYYQENVQVHFRKQ